MLHIPQLKEGLYGYAIAYLGTINCQYGCDNNEVMRTDFIVRSVSYLYSNVELSDLRKLTSLRQNVF